jgi:hypothetical protein
MVSSFFDSIRTDPFVPPCENRESARSSSYFPKNPRWTDQPDRKLEGEAPAEPHLQETTNSQHPTANELQIPTSN